MPQTVIILGAGASSEVGLPVGDGLKQQIADMLDIRFDYSDLKSGDVDIVEAVRIHIKPERDANPHWQAARRIAMAMPQAISIDNFIDAHKGDAKIEICGKLAIVRSILRAEKQCALFRDTTRSSGGFQDAARVTPSRFNT